MEPLLIEWRDMSPRAGLKRLNEMLRTPWCIWNAVVFHDFYPKADKHRLLGGEMRAGWWLARLARPVGSLVSSGVTPGVGEYLEAVK